MLSWKRLGIPIGNAEVKLSLGEATSQIEISDNKMKSAQIYINKDFNVILDKKKALPLNYFYFTAYSKMINFIIIKPN